MAFEFQATTRNATALTAALDGQGNLFYLVSDRVQRVDTTTRFVSTIAGGGTIIGLAADGAPATDARLQTARGIALDSQGNIFVGEEYAVRRIDGVSGVISTVASGLLYPSSLIFDAQGDLIVAEQRNNRVIRIDVNSGAITTIAGDGTQEHSGDGGLATAASLFHPCDVALDGQGNLFIASSFGNHIRRVDAVSGIIETHAGVGGLGGYSGDGGPATAAEFDGPGSIAIDTQDDLLVMDRWNCRIRRIDALSGIITTFAGNGCSGKPLDGEPVGDTAVAVGSLSSTTAGDLLVAGTRIRRIDAVTGVLTTVVGSIDPPGVGPLEASTVGVPHALAPISDGEWLITDSTAGRVRSLSIAAARVSSVVGYPDQDGPLARYSRMLNAPYGVAVDPAGAIYVSEQGSHTIRRIDAAADPWTIADFAGALDSAGHADGDLPIALFDSPCGLVFDSTTGTLYVADAGNHVVRAIDDAGAVTTVAGTAQNRGFFGEGIAATEARLFGPEALALGADGSLYIADTLNHSVRRVDPSGVITTVIGDRTASSTGDGMPASMFPVDAPRGLAVDVFGNLFITSRTAIRVVAAGEDGIATGTDEVATIYGAFPRDTFPASVTNCLTDLAFDPQSADNGVLHFLDACQGFFVQLSRQP